MKTTKRLSAFLMAVMICVSFCMTHIAAALQHYSIEWQGDPVYEEFIEDEDSYAYVYCTNYGWNEETYTDFRAETNAINVFYGIDRQYYARANVSVGLYYDDEQLWVNDSDTDSCDATAEGLTAEACVYGNDMIDMDHGIEDFSTDHWIDICINDGGELVPIDNYGQSIEVTTSY